MAGKFTSTWFYSSLDTYEHKKMFGTETRYTERRVDTAAFAKSLQQKYEELDAEGYDVINVVPIVHGQSEPSISQNNGYLGDMGFSITRGAVVIGKRRDC